MELCDDGHDEVCFDARECPVCEEQGKIRDLEYKIDDLEDKIKDLEKG